jgi:probable phosphoglycerate mutase
MTRLIFIRHAATDAVGRRIAGRSAVPLNDVGRAQADRLAHRLVAEAIDVVYTSPEERARDTARPLAAARGLEAIAAPELDEIDYGDWTGRNFGDLAALPEWLAFNTMRSVTRIPNGELIIEVQQRVVGFIDRVRSGRLGESLALVSHAEPIRAALAYYLGVPIDLALRYDVDPASVSIIELGSGGPRVRSLNLTEAILG